MRDGALERSARFRQPSRPRCGARVRVLILTGLGLNCEAETAAAFRLAGASPERVHLLDLLDGTGGARLTDYPIVAFIGGFAFGDHLGAGFVFANKIRWRLYDPLLEFVARGGLALGICNGFQTMVRLGMLPGLDGDYRTPRATLAPNDRLGYRDAWVRLAFDPASPCVWTRGLDDAGAAVAPRRGQVPRREPGGCWRASRRSRQVAARYIGPDGQPTEEWPHNPNGSPGGVAGICDPSGRLFGLMPHPDAYLYRFHHPNWTRLARAGALPEEGAGWRSSATASTRWLPGSDASLSR